MPENDTPVSKTQVIRDYLAEHPDASRRAVAEALVAQGFQVSPAFVAGLRATQEPPPVPEPGMPPMHLSFGEGKLFYKLYAALCSYANGKLKLVLGEFSDPEQFTSLPPDIRRKVRDALHAQPELIDQFVQENSAHLPAEELAIVAGWKHAVIGNFYVFRYLKQGLDGVGQRLHQGHPTCATGTSGGGLQEGHDPVHPGRPRQRFRGRVPWWSSERKE